MIYLKPGIHLALFDNSAIVLKVNEGEYIIYTEGIFQAIAKELDSSLPALATKETDVLCNDGVISISPESQVNSAIYDYRDYNFNGFNSSSWGQRKLSSADSQINARFRNVMNVIMVCLALKTYGFKSIQKLTEPLNGKASRNQKTIIDIEEEVEKIHKAVLWSPFKIACLEWSLTIVRHLRKKGINAKLVIGVRPIPFLAHTWPEIDGYVIADTQDVRKIFGVIYESL
ncbi:TPA: lasso peptide biosynthesis B2 protein [Klebsiella pneumoniae]